MINVSEKYKQQAILANPTDSISDIEQVIGLIKGEELLPSIQPLLSLNKNTKIRLALSQVKKLTPLAEFLLSEFNPNQDVPSLDYSDFERKLFSLLSRSTTEEVFRSLLPSSYLRKLMSKIPYLPESIKINLLECADENILYNFTSSNIGAITELSVQLKLLEILDKGEYPLSNHDIDIYQRVKFFKSFVAEQGKQDFKYFTKEAQLETINLLDKFITEYYQTWLAHYRPYKELEYEVTQQALNSIVTSFHYQVKASLTGGRTDFDSITKEDLDDDYREVLEKNISERLPPITLEQENCKQMIEWIDKIFLGLRYAPMLDSLTKTQLNIMACNNIDSNVSHATITEEMSNSSSTLNRQKFFREI